MDIVSRLKSFLDQNGIGNAQFADTCEIPRPTVSQLLNGRNKKVSDEVITKIHKAYPVLNIMWLMFGDGSMFVPDDATDGGVNPHGAYSSKTPQSNGAYYGAPVGEKAPGSGAGHPQKSISFDSDGDSPTQRGTSSLSAALQDIARSVGTTKPNPVSASPGRGRQIVNIMIFYDDNSFESIIPAQ